MSQLPKPDRFHEGPPRYFIPVSIRTPTGTWGVGYEESDRPREPIVLRKDETE